MKYLLFLLLGAKLVGGEWVNYAKIQPKEIVCDSQQDAQIKALLYCQDVGGISVEYIPPTFSMSRTYKVGDFYVIEKLPFGAAGGFPAVFWPNDLRFRRNFHWIIARDVLGRYITQGDSVRNSDPDQRCGLALPVIEDRYIGVVRTRFTWKR